MMKILHKLLVLNAFCLVSVFATAQSSDLLSISKKSVDPFIQEVYKVGDNPVSISNPQRYRQLSALLNERVFFMESKETIDKAVNIRDVKLFNKYNTELQRDTDFQLNTFNPLKYDLPFWSISNSLFRLGDSSYYLVIKGQSFK